MVPSIVSLENLVRLEKGSWGTRASESHLLPSALLAGMCLCCVLVTKAVRKKKSLVIWNVEIALSLDECTLISPLKKPLHVEAAFLSFDATGMRRAQSTLSRLVTWVADAKDLAWIPQLEL